MASKTPTRLQPLFQERQASLLILRNFVSRGQHIDCSLSGFSREVVKSDFLSAFKFLQAGVKIVGLARLFAHDAKGHGSGAFWRTTPALASVL